MHVCIVSPAVPPTVGGSETLTANACLALVPRAVTVHLVTGTAVSPSLSRAITEAGGTVTTVARRPRPEELEWEYDEFYRATAVHEVVTAHPVEVVHAFSHDAAVASAVATHRAPGISVGATFSELATDSSDFGLARSAFVHSLEDIDVFIAPSRCYAALARRHGACQAKVRVMTAGVRTEAMANGVADVARRRLNLPARVPVISCPSRFTPRKGQHLLLEAHAGLVDAGVSALLVLAGSTNSGDAAFLERLRGRVAELGTERSVLFVEDLGQEEVPHLLAASDVVVQPSLREGLGLLALEAMAAGRPVVLTRIEGFDEFAVDGANCELVPPGDAEALGRAIARLLADPDARARLASGARETAARFSLERMGDSLIDIYGRVVGRSSHR